MRQEQTKEKLIKLASKLMKEKGYSSFSYADLANEIGISKASIHHHFPSKADLGVAVAEENCVLFKQALENITQQYQSFNGRIAAYFLLFSDSPEELPMCATLSADKNNLPESLKIHAQQHFELQINWLEKIIQTAIEQNELPPTIQANELAISILNLVEGASLTAKALNRKDIFDISLNNLKMWLNAV